MDVKTIQTNLLNTIDGKEKLRAVYAKQLRDGGDAGLISNIVVQFLDINLTELRNILNDVKKLPTPGTGECPISWRDVMQVKRMGFGWIADAAEAAKNLGYEYFLWNDRVYSVAEGDTGWLGEDLK